MGGRYWAYDAVVADLANPSPVNSSIDGDGVSTAGAVGNPFGTGLGTYFLKQPGEPGHWCSLATTDSIGSLWAGARGTQASRFSVWAGMQVQTSPDIDNSSLQGAVVHGSVVIFATPAGSGGDMSNPGVRLYEAFGRLTITDGVVVYAQGDTQLGFGPVPPQLDHIPGPVDFYMVFEVYPDFPDVLYTVNGDQGPDFAYGWSLVGPAYPQVQQRTFFVDHVLHVQHTIAEGAGPFRLAYDWDDGSPVDVHDFPRDPSWTTTYEVTHEYASHDYFTDNANGPQYASMLLLDSGIANIINSDDHVDSYWTPGSNPARGGVYHTFGEGGTVDLGSGTPVGPQIIYLPVPLLTGDQLVVDGFGGGNTEASAPPATVRTVVQDTGLQWGPAGYYWNGSSAPGTGVADVKFEWWFPPAGIAATPFTTTPQHITTSSPETRVITQPGNYWASVRVTNSVGWSNAIRIDSITVDDGPDLQGRGPGYRVHFEL